ncbi:FRIGIDA-like protein 2 [Sesamum angolense]|uniref:FRIGIDA-like protein n=1 Tax=Sesamum angolense TaxID=2727404 RepID=A0AAE1X8L3_9LAMI|nr:FRIGIDA-like protein 2 [Sesamum angolense]
MEKLFDALSKRTSVAENLVNYLRERLSEIDSRHRNLDLVRESVVGRMMEIECHRESLEKRLRDLEEREKEFDSFREGKRRKLASEEEEMTLKREQFVEEVKTREKELHEKLVSVHEHIEWLEVARTEVQGIRRRACQKLKEIESEEQNLRSAEESLAAREKKVEVIIRSLDERIRAVEEREKGFDSFLERKMRELELKEKQLSVKWEEFVKEIKLADDKYRDQEKLRHGVIDRLELAENKLEAIGTTIDERFEEIEVRENVMWEPVKASIKEADLIRESLEKQFKEFEKMKRDFHSFQEEKMQELVLKEQQLSVMSKELVKGAKLREEQLTEREKLRDSFLEAKMRELALKEKRLSMRWEELVEKVKFADDKLRDQEKSRHGIVERLELAENKLEAIGVTIDERFEEIEIRGNATWESVIESVKEADLIRESLEKQLKELEKMKREFHSFQEEKMKELVSKEQQLSLMSKELVKEAKLRDHQLTEREQLGCKLLKRLELAQHNVEDLKEMVCKRFREIGLKETELNSVSDWVERKMDEVDSNAKELEEKEKRMIIKEGHLISKEDELQRKKEELHMREKNLASWQKELEIKEKEVDSAKEINEQRLEVLERREKNLTSVRGFIHSCFKKHLATKKQVLLERDLVEKHARHLKHKEQKLEYTVRQLEFREVQMWDHLKDPELKQQGLTDACNGEMKIEPDESADLKFIVRMDGKTLQMFLNDPEKDLESMGDEIFKVLHLSSDPAKLVLDAMVGFYPPHLRKGDTEFNVRKTCIILLEQLIKMSPNIQPYVTEKAFELASAWKLKMRPSAQNPLEVLGFLHLLAAYNLASHFDKDEVISFLVMVAQHSQTSELRRILGFPEGTSGSLF